MLTKFVYYFSRLQFLICILYCLLGINELTYVGICQVFPAETTKKFSVKSHFELWFSKQSSEVTSFHDWTILHQL